MSTAQSQIRVLQVNLRHSKSASIHLSQVILDLDLDIILIQEPYAFLSSSGAIIVDNIPPGYTPFHNLSTDHAFGAAILAKTSLNATAVHLADSNHCSCVRVSPNLLFFSIYCRPSMPSIPAFFSSILASITPNLKRFSIFGCDANAKNKIWNSPRTDNAGLELEHIFRSNALSVANVDYSVLSHKPSNTQFLDISLVGDQISLSNWHFPSLPSLSDHPYISFVIDRLHSNGKKSSRVPRPNMCNLDIFRSSLADQLDMLPAPSVVESFSSETDIDVFMASVYSSLPLSITSSMLPFHPSNAPAKMPWWCKSLWAMRHNLRNAYKLKCQPDAPDYVISDYKILKANYQKVLRKKGKVGSFSVIKI